MAHNSKRNRRDTTTQDGDDYIYPTAKVRETKTRDRRSGKNQIRKGLADLENQGLDDFAEAEMDDWYDDTPIASEDDIDDFYDRIDEEERIENEEGGFLDDINTDWDRRWEDY